MLNSTHLLFTDQTVGAFQFHLGQPLRLLLLLQYLLMLLLLYLLSLYLSDPSSSIYGLRFDVLFGGIQLFMLLSIAPDRIQPSHCFTYPLSLSS